MNVERPLLIAEPVAEREWRVVSGIWDRAGGAQVLGFIEELGGVYEVEIVDQPELSQFFDTFKEAVDCFSEVGKTHGELDARQLGAA